MPLFSMLVTGSVRPRQIFWIWLVEARFEPNIENITLRQEPVIRNKLFQSSIGFRGIRYATQMTSITKRHIVHKLVQTDGIGRWGGSLIDVGLIIRESIAGRQRGRTLLNRDQPHDAVQREDSPPCPGDALEAMPRSRRHSPLKIEWGP